jgi:hypothetical protein
MREIARAESGTRSALPALVPSPLHEAPLLLLREEPNLIVWLLERGLGIALPPFEHVNTGSHDFSEAVPVERRADGVVVLEVEENARRRAVMGIVVEVQLAIDPDKRFAWPFYLASLHARLRCPCALVVVATSETVAAWARGAIESFQPGSHLAPWVMGPDAIPRLDDLSDALAHPELAVLSAIVHGARSGGEPTIGLAYAAVSGLDGERARTYLDLVLANVGDVGRAILEALMQQKYEYQSDFAKKYYGQGKAEGRAEGHAEGLRAALYGLASSRGIMFSDASRARIDGCSDVERLTRWVVRAASATSDTELFDGDE